MKVFLAGATGAIGRRLLPLLVNAGHSVTGTTRAAGKCDQIASTGARALVMDALDAQSVMNAVRQVEPDVVIHQLTAIPARFNVRRWDQAFAPTNRLRRVGTDNLLAAARAAGCRRFIAQSYAGWTYECSGGWIKTEADRLTSTPEPGMLETWNAIVHLESAVLGATGLQGCVLRYGSFYGPGTSLGKGGSFLEDIRHRRMPQVGKGTGYWSFLHIEDAAAATLAAVESELTGVFNIVDDEPAPVSEWLPYLANALGAKPPIHIPAWLGRVAIGSHGVALMTSVRGASNQKAKKSFQWKLKWPSWRQGFQYGLGDESVAIRSGAAVRNFS